MNEVATIFNEEVYELYGFNYSDTDDTRIIETLNYGNDNLEFEEFLSLMEEYKKEFSPGVN